MFLSLKILFALDLDIIVSHEIFVRRKTSTWKNIWLVVRASNIPFDYYMCLWIL